MVKFTNKAHHESITVNNALSCPGTKNMFLPAPTDNRQLKSCNYTTTANCMKTAR